jgi:PhnB protein
MDVAPYLNFQGECAAAFAFYEKCLGGRIESLQTFGESPMTDQVPADWRGKVLHARLVVGDKALLGSDAPPGRYNTPQGMMVSLSLPRLADAERIFGALADGGKVTMPFQKTFWSPGFGMAVDRFGIPWIVNCDQPA